VGGTAEISEDVKLKVLRRERIWDLTHAERGFGNAGIIPQSFYPIEEKLEDLSYRAGRLLPFAQSMDVSMQLVALTGRLGDLKAELNFNYRQAKNEMVTRITEMSLDELQAKSEWGGNLLAAYKLEPVEKDVKAMESLLKKEIEKAKQDKTTQEIGADQRAVPDLIKELKADDAGVRKEAALELGRIGAERAIQPLIAALDDREYPVRRNAIYALGWMQAKKAVLPLLEIARKTACIQTKRRAVEALGLIGDKRAVDFLIGEIGNADLYARQNAILSLGWIGDAKASAPLCRILTEGMSQGRTREDMACAIRALSHLGDKSVIPALEEAQKKYPEAPGGFYEMYLTISNAVDLAVAEIGNGGRKASGVSQSRFLGEKENFYWLQRRYNAFYGRFFRYGGSRTPEEMERMSRFAKASGITGFIDCDWNKPYKILKEYPEYPAFMSAEGLKWIPAFWRRGTTVFDKAGFEYELGLMSDYSCLGGYWAEEGLTWAAGFADEQAFRAFLLKKYGKKLSDLGYAKLEEVKVPALNKEGRKNNFLWTEYMEYVAEKGRESWQEAQEWLMACRKGLQLMYNTSSRYTSGGSTYIGGYAAVNEVIGANGPQSYGCHSFDNSFNLEMTVDGEARPALGEWYAHQSDCVGRVERGFAASLLHGQCFFAMDWTQIYKHPRNLLIMWEEGRSYAAARQFRKAAAISDYIVQAQSPKIVAQMYSGRTSTLSYGKDSPDMWGGRCYPYTQNQEGIWEALIQSHLPVDLVWAETTDSRKLARYKILVLSDARCLSGAETENIRAWVKGGGLLVATAGTSLHDPWDRPAGNYLLADVFGADYVGSKMSSDKFRHVERGLRPESGIGKIRINDPDYVRCMEGKKEAEYEQAQGYDSLKLTSGKVVGAWEDGTPAVIENRFGAGGCIFIAATWPGLSHTGRATTIDPLYRDFWDGARELLAGCVKRGLEITGVTVPLEVENCPKQVEVALRTQEDKKRWIIQCLNYDPKLSVVKDMVVKVRPPSLSNLKAYYPYPARENLVYKELAGGVVEVKVRNFDIHEIVVMEW